MIYKIKYNYKKKKEKKILKIKISKKKIIFDITV